MTKRDYYEVLEVSKTANADEIKKSFRKLAKKYHPDQNSGDKTVEQKFKEINEAYEVLKDKDKKAAYDRYGHAAFDQTTGGGSYNHGFTGFGNAHSRGSAGGFDDFADMFSNFFHDMAGTSKHSSAGKSGLSTRGSDLSHELWITLNEAFSGKKQTIKYSTLLKCDKCNGTGSASPDGGNIKCSMCHGKGRVITTQGFFRIEQTCSKCNGEGVIIKDPCKTCRSEGRIEKHRTTEISIPRGINDGDRLRIIGAGEAGVRGGESGDLYVIIHIQEHKFYKRQGSSIKCSIPIKMVTAAVGGVVSIPSIDGSEIKISVPHGTQNGTELRVRGKGMPLNQNADSFGDLFVKIIVETPTNLSAKQKEMLEQFDNHASSDTSPQSTSFFQKIKDFFN